MKKLFAPFIITTALSSAQDSLLVQEFNNDLVESVSNGWTLAQAQISRQLSVDAYCGHKEYMDHVYAGAAAGFIPTLTIYNPSKDVEGYIGYLPSDKSIYVVFRGSVSITNWFTNLDTDKSPY